MQAKNLNPQAKTDGQIEKTELVAPVFAQNMIVNILIVDDEPKNLTVLETVLNEPDYRLVKAASANEALLALLAEEFAVLILDIQMPGISGIELAQMIKERKKTSQIPIIFLTAYYSEDEHMIEGYDAGAVDYLLKPLNPTILRSKVAVFAELHRKHRELERANSALRGEIMERREVQRQLGELNETLEERVLERTEAHRSAEEQIRILMSEVTHRSKNLLSVILSVAKYTRASTAEEFLGRFTNRVHALASNHDLLVKSQWKNIEILDLIRGQLTHFGDVVGKRILLDGPQVQLSASAAQSIGMAIHELSTNAVKYGALSDGNGRVEISWSVDDKRSQFSIEWIESGGPAVAAPPKLGFGSTVLTTMIEMGLDGETRLEYATTGVVWQFKCPIKDGIELSSPDQVH